MGMYTRIVFDCKLKDNLPKEIENEISRYFDYGSFFRYNNGGVGRSFFEKRKESYENYFISINCDIKYSPYEIDLFLNLIEEWIDPYFGGFMGYKIHELEKNPTLIYFIGGKIVFENLSNEEECVDKEINSDEKNINEKKQGLRDDYYQGLFNSDYSLKKLSSEKEKVCLFCYHKLNKKSRENYDIFIFSENELSPKLTVGNLGDFMVPIECLNEEYELMDL